MIDDQDFTIDTGDQEQAAVAPSNAAPKVVIVYRNRGLSSALLPPVVVLLCALLILSHQRRTPIRVFAPSALSAAVPEPAPSPAPAIEEPPSPSRVAPAEPAAPRADPQSKTPAPMTAATPEPSAEPLAPTPEPPPPEPKPKPKERTAIVSNLPRDPEPAEPDRAVTRDQALEEIRREAEEREAEIHRLEELQPVARKMQMAESYRRVQANRLPFHAALREALREPEPKRADAIASACDSFGRSVPEEIRQRVVRLLKTSHATMSRNAKIDLMRAWGLPEPMVLDFLAHDIERMLGTRGGPRSEDEVLVWAARTLLTLPPKPQAGTQNSRPNARSVPRTSPAPRPRFQ